MERRQDRVARYITDSRAEMQLPMMAERALGSSVQQWLDRLRFIPDDHLDECYQMAMDAHANRNALMPKELQDQWAVLRQRGVDHPAARQDKTCRYWCSEGGWIIVDADGVLVPSDSRGRAEYTYAKPCPDHRPKGVRINGSDPMMSGLPRPKHVDTTFVSSRKNREGSSEGFAQMKQVAEQILARAPEEKEVTSDHSYTQSEPFWDEPPLEDQAPF